jgi:hypothetical protein
MSFILSIMKSTAKIVIIKVKMYHEILFLLMLHATLLHTPQNPRQRLCSMPLTERQIPRRCQRRVHGYLHRKMRVFTLPRLLTPGAALFHLDRTNDVYQNIKETTNMIARMLLIQNPEEIIICFHKIAIACFLHVHVAASSAVVQ